MDTIYSQSIITLTFTKDGQIILYFNDQQELDVVLRAYIGKENQKYNTIDNSMIIADGNHYKQALAYAIGSQKYSVSKEIKAIVYGNAQYIVDCGTLQRDFQIEELATSDYESFIRIDFPPLYEMKSPNYVDIYQIRFASLTADFNENKTRLLTYEEFENVDQQSTPISSNLRCLLDKDVLNKIKSFSEKLHSYHKDKEIK